MSKPANFSRLSEIVQSLKGKRFCWMVTGAAGFIGSHLVEQLLRANQQVRGLDNFCTGSQENIDAVLKAVGSEGVKNFTFREIDVSRVEDVYGFLDGVQIILHQAALGSVPRSIESPLDSHVANVDGFASVLAAAVRRGIKRIVYASSSSVYGDIESDPKTEDELGEMLSPYALTKRVNELYADVFARTYGMELVGLRYFNVFGSRQDPEGPYAAVIPRWIENCLRKQQSEIYGDGFTSRDFCHVDNVVQANFLAALADNFSGSKVYNVGLGGNTTLKDLYSAIARLTACDLKPAYCAFRPGDIRFSRADISKIKQDLGYRPDLSVESGLEQTVEWFRERIPKEP